MMLSIEKRTAPAEDDQKTICLDDNRELSPELPKYERDPVPAVVIEADFGAREFGMTERRELRKVALELSKGSGILGADWLRVLIAINAQGILPDENMAEMVAAELKAHDEDTRVEKLSRLYDRRHA